MNCETLAGQLLIHRLFLFMKKTGDQSSGDLAGWVVMVMARLGCVGEISTRPVRSSDGWGTNPPQVQRDYLLLRHDPETI